MRLSNPNKYKIYVKNNWYEVRNDKDTYTFISPDTIRCPKVYVFAVDEQPVYIGQTVQSMAARIGLGFRADGSSGYYGYRWRHELSSVRLLVWRLEEVTEEDELHELECIESETVLAYRQTYNQWPKYQTEIHFHQTSGEHRALAIQVFNTFRHSVKTQESD
jgi:hypothetical protein